MSENESVRRTEKAGLLNFTREMVSALVMAFVFIVYVIQAFRIPTGSMENSLLVGDFLLGLKFIYGSPVLPLNSLGTFWKLPGVTKPKPGDIIIFRYPGANAKDYIKRCVAGPGQTIQTSEKSLIVDGTPVELPPRGQYTDNGILQDPWSRFTTLAVRATVQDNDTVYESPQTQALIDSIAAIDSTRVFSVHRRALLRLGDTIPLPPQPTYRRDGKLVVADNMPVENRITYFSKLRIPAAGDTLRPASLDVREFLFAKHLIHQEHPRKKVTARFRLMLDGEYADGTQLTTAGGNYILVDSYLADLDKIDNWLLLDNELRALAGVFQGHSVEYRKSILLNDKPLDSYVVRHDNYFMMGDNRDNSLDSRFWGYLNANFIKAKAFILYFSLDKETPLWLLPLKIRWNRIGKLIRSWEVEQTPADSSQRAAVSHT